MSSRRSRIQPSLVDILWIGARQLDEEFGHPSDNGFNVFRSLLGSSARGIANARVGGDTRPGTRCPRPTFAHSFWSRALCGTRPGFIERTNEVGCNVHHDARFELTGVITRLLEERGGIDDLPPLDRADEHRGARRELADY